VAFKAFALMPMTVLFSLPQMVFLKRYRTDEGKSSFWELPRPKPVPVRPPVTPVRQPS
jgi:hypothetical protein